jgi:hypothetical protein
LAQNHGTNPVPLVCSRVPLSKRYCSILPSRRPSSGSRHQQPSSTVCMVPDANRPSHPTLNAQRSCSFSRCSSRMELIPLPLSVKTASRCRTLQTSHDVLIYRVVSQHPMNYLLHSAISIASLKLAQLILHYFYYHYYLESIR